MDRLDWLCLYSSVCWSSPGASRPRCHRLRPPHRRPSTAVPPTPAPPTAVPPTPVPPTATPPTPAADLIAPAKAYLAALNAGDVDGVLALVTDDVKWVEWGGNTVREGASANLT